MFQTRSYCIALLGSVKLTFLKRFPQDVRPALDSFTALWDRTKAMTMRWRASRYSAGSDTRVYHTGEAPQETKQSSVAPVQNTSN